MGVLCYHAVDPFWESPLAVTPDEFARQMTDLATRGGAVPLGMGASWRARAVTFDDGFVSVLHHALPVLRRWRLPATLFVVADTLVPPARPVDWVRPPGDFTPLTVSVPQLLELEEAGVTIASHSWSHLELPSLTEAECVEDLRRSRELLEDLLHRPVPHLAYPFGLHSPHVRRAAQRAGYELAFSLPEGPEHTGQYAVPRAGIYRGNSTATWRLKSSPWWMRLRLSAAYRRRATVSA